MADRTGIAITCPSCLAQLQVEMGPAPTTIVCYKCGDPCPVPAAPATVPVPVLPPPPPTELVTCAACQTRQNAPPGHGIFPCNHCGHLIRTASKGHADLEPDERRASDGASDGAPVLPIPNAYHGPTRMEYDQRAETPADRAVDYVFNDVIGRNQVTAACYGILVIYLGLTVLIALGSLPKHSEIAVGAGEALLPIAAVLLVLPWLITAGTPVAAARPLNPEWIVLWAVLMVPVLIFLEFKGIYAAGIVPVLVLSILLMLKAVTHRPGPRR